MVSDLSSIGYASNLTLHPIALAAAGASYSESDKARDRVDQERENDGVETKGEHAVQEGQAPHSAGCDLHVRDLTGHADDKGVVGKIKIIGRTITRENQTASMSSWFVTVPIK